MTFRNTLAFITTVGLTGTLVIVGANAQLRPRQTVLQKVPLSVAKVSSFTTTPVITKYLVTLTDTRGLVNGLQVSPTTFNYGIVSPRDPQSGLPTGRRQHQPLRFTEQVGGWSPNLFQAMTNNAAFPSVEIDMIGSGADGRDVVVQSIKLTNASMASYRQFCDGSVRSQLMEEIAFTFQKIEITNNISKTTAMDDWATNNS